MGFKSAYKTKRSLRNNPAWQIVVRGELWICPYCGAKLRWTEDETRMRERISEHLDNTCPVWKKNSAREMTLARLQELSEKYELELKILEDPVWRVSDRMERWYCPYCGEPTPIRLTINKNSVPDDVLKEILEHIKDGSKCSGGTNPMTLEALKERTEVHDRYATARELARTGYYDHPELWLVFDVTDHWLCPYCLEPTTVIRDWESKAEHELVEKLASHLAGCASFNGQPPTATKEDLRGRLLYLDERRRALKRIREDQLSVIPKQHPQLEGFDIFTIWRAAYGATGDFYYYFDLEGQRLGVLLGDISGHGAQGSLIRQIIQSFSENVRRHDSPVETVSGVYHGIMEVGLGEGIFVTLLYAIIDPSEATVRLVRAGHDFPLLINPSRNPSAWQVKLKGGMPIGVGSQEVFSRSLKELTLKLSPGDILLFYTDGVTEARAPTGEQFGVRRLSRVVRESAHLTSEQIVRKIMETVDIFRAQGGAEDDVTLMAIKYNG